MAENLAHYIDVRDITSDELLVYVSELVCFEETYAASQASGDLPTLADTVLGEYEPTEYFNWFTSMFGKGFPLIHTPLKGIGTDKFDPTRTTVTELDKIIQLKRQPRFAATNSKLLAFTVPTADIISVDDFYKLTTAIRKAQYLGCNISFTPNI